MTHQKTPDGPQERPEGGPATPAPSEESSGPQAGAQRLNGEQQPRGPVDWARHYADQREERAAGDPAWDTLRARAFNAVQPALRQAGEWLPLSARRAVADAVLAELKRELDAFAEYENAINWMTTCTSCARVLDSSIRETERAERAEAAIARVRALHVPLTYPDPDMPGTKAVCVGCEDATSEHPCNTLAALNDPAPRPAATQAADDCTTACDGVSGIRGLFEHVGIDTTGRDITVAGRVVNAAPAHNAGPSVAECAQADRAHWDAKYAGEGQ